jgi:PAS domain S-box-containing protein
MADPVRPLLDGGASAVEDNKPGRKASGGTGRASGAPGAEPSAASGSTAPLTAKTLTDAQSLMADELPDGLVVADDAGRVVVYNRAAVRLTGVAASDAIGKYVYDVLPFRDDDGRDWWMFVDPYNGLATRTRHPERSLFLADGLEVLVSVGYVRDGRSGSVRRLVITLRGAQQRARLERSRA